MQKVFSQQLRLLLQSSIYLQYQQLLEKKRQKNWLKIKKPFFDDFGVDASLDTKVIQLRALLLVILTPLVPDDELLLLLLLFIKVISK